MKRVKVLVVGGAGYIGSHMVKDLLGAGHEVITLDDLSTGHRDLLPGGDFVEGDLEDAALLDRIFSQNEIAAVMHFAAFALVGESVENPLRNRLSDGGWHLYPGLHPCQRPDPGPPTGPRGSFDRRGQ